MYTQSESIPLTVIEKVNVGEQLSRPLVAATQRNECAVVARPFLNRSFSIRGDKCLKAFIIAPFVKMSVITLDQCRLFVLGQQTRFLIDATQYQQNMELMRSKHQYQVLKCQTTNVYLWIQKIELIHESLCQCDFVDLWYSSEINS